MGRRKKRKRIIPRLKRTIPKVFQCPYCGKQSLTISIEKVEEKEAIAKAMCGSCGFYTELAIHPFFQPVDVYGRILDLMEQGTLNFEIRKVEEHEVEGESS